MARKGRREHHDDLEPQTTLMMGSIDTKIPPKNADSEARGSFSSFREADDGPAQTFSSSKISSYTHFSEDVVDDWSGSSWEDLRRLDLGQHVGDLKPASRLSGPSFLESLPVEILSNIIDRLVVEIPPKDLSTRNTDLVALLLTSQRIHRVTLSTLYRHITIPHSRIFRKFLSTIGKNPYLATLSRTLDFNHFNPSTHFMTASQRAQTKNLTAETLSQCLELTSHLHEFLAQEYIDEDLSADVLRRLFFQQPNLQALDFCACSSPPFRDAFTTILDDPWPEMLPIKRLSFHKCLSLPSSVFEMIMPRLGQLTHLDVAATRITDEALSMIPTTASLTHLNLAKCKRLSADAVIKFLTSHPAATQNLTFLSLAAEASSHTLLEAEDLDRLLPLLPTTLRSLSLKGSKMNSSHVPGLIRLTGHLEELAIGRGLELDDVMELFYDAEAPLEGRSFKGPKPRAHALRYLDTSDMEFSIGSSSALLAAATSPLCVIELKERGVERVRKIKRDLEPVGWTAQESSSRFWLVRVDADGITKDQGGRWWKMGAESWGMRKIPVTSAEVGGMYGSFMFGRRL